MKGGTLPGSMRNASKVECLGFQVLEDGRVMISKSGIGSRESEWLSVRLQLRSWIWI